jgi:hypothetical protein
MIEWACAGQRFLDSEKSKQEGQKSLLQRAVEEEDMDLLKFIIELGGEQKALLAEEEDDQKCYTIDRAVFYTAIRLGRTAMLAEMIKVSKCPGDEFHVLMVSRLPVSEFHSTSSLLSLVLNLRPSRDIIKDSV